MKKLFRLIERDSKPTRPVVVHNPAPETETDWFSFGEEEGQLSVDVYQTEDHLVVKSTIAGAEAKDIEISLEEDMLTIRGRRDLADQPAEEAYLYRECYWGKFSRTVILPVEIKHDKVAATLHNGVLTVVLPKARRSKQTKIKVKDQKV